MRTIWDVLTTTGRDVNVTYPYRPSHALVEPPNEVQISVTVSPGSDNTRRQRFAKRLEGPLSMRNMLGQSGSPEGWFDRAQGAEVAIIRPGAPGITAKRTPKTVIQTGHGSGSKLLSMRWRASPTRGGCSPRASAARGLRGTRGDALARPAEAIDPRHLKAEDPRDLRMQRRTLRIGRAHIGGPNKLSAAAGLIRGRREAATGLVTAARSAVHTEVGPGRAGALQRNAAAGDAALAGRAVGVGAALMTRALARVLTTRTDTGPILTDLRAGTGTPTRAPTAVISTHATGARRVTWRWRRLVLFVLVLLVLRLRREPRPKSAQAERSQYAHEAAAGGTCQQRAGEGIEMLSVHHLLLSATTDRTAA